MTLFFACLALAGVILFGLGAKGVVLARIGCAGARWQARSRSGWESPPC